MTEKTPACCRCGSCNVEPLCHELPDPQFICNECLQEMAADGSAWIKPVVLTIDKNRLRDLWLPCIREGGEALDYLNGLCIKAVSPRKPRFEHLHRAYCALSREWVGDVEQARERGGLLLIGGKF